MPLEQAHSVQARRPSSSAHPNRRRSARAIVLTMFITAAAVAPNAADAQLQRSGQPDVSFSATGPAGLSIVGKGTDLTVVDHSRTITVLVPLSSLSTGIGLRDKHMKEKYLEVAKYPDAELQVGRQALALPDLGKEVAADAEGMLKLHGQTRPVRFHYKAKREGGAYAVQGTMHVTMTDYGIVVPSYLGVSVKPDVEVAVRFEAVDK